MNEGKKCCCKVAIKKKNRLCATVKKHNKIKVN